MASLAPRSSDGARSCLEHKNDGSRGTYLDDIDHLSIGIQCSSDRLRDSVSKPSLHSVAICDKTRNFEGEYSAAQDVQSQLKGL
jgi:hypothetical protein